ncbi:hypothetical protein [Chryseobacterium oranimense]|uniref:hypothetical protein n=1 Tax=Chryseobacterium oranimense TaxID=421058 RepID=UPI0022365B4A|nr:hypothetical protein [Chryseobacterium oranimense]
MNQNILDSIQELINKWIEENGNFLFQEKKDHWVENPAISGEYLIKFSIKLKTFLCDKVLIPIELVSDIFQTTTLSKSNTNDNIDADRLDKFLKDFDNQFQDLVTQKVSECRGVVETTDPFHMK